MIPYANQITDPDGQRLFSVCPECGELIYEPTDATGEPTENNYGKHYQKEHA